MNSPPRVIRQTARAALSPRGLNELNLQPNILWPDTRSSRKVLKPKPKKKTKGGRRRKKRTRRRRRRRRSRKRRGRGISQSKPQEEKEDARAAAHLRRLDEIQEERDFKIACMKRFMNSASTNDIDQVQRLWEGNFVKAAYAVMIKWCKENPTNTMNIGGRRRKNRRKKRTRRRKGGQPKQNQKRARLAATDEQWAKKVGASGLPIAVGPNITANHPAVRSSPGAYLARLQLATQDSQQLAKNEKYMNELLEFDD